MMLRILIASVVAGMVLFSGGCAHVRSEQEQPAAEPAAAAEAGEAQVETPTDVPAVALTPELLYYVLLGEIAIQRGEYATAADVLSRAARQSGDYRIAERATRTALQARDYQRALDGARLWSELRPETGAPLEVEAVVLVQQGRLDDAESRFRKLIERGHPSVGIVYRRVAELLGHQNNGDGALAVMDRLILMHPDNPEAHFSRAYLADRFKRPELMIESVETALALRPDWEDAALAKAVYLATQKQDKDEVVAFSEEFLRRNPGAAKFRLHYARYLVDQNENADALKQFEFLVKDDPENADASFAAGVLSLQLEQLDKAERYLLHTIEQRQENDQARLYLGQVALERERYDEAEKWLREVADQRFQFDAALMLGGVIAKNKGSGAGLEYLRAVEPRNEEEGVRLVLAEEQMLREAKDLTGAKVLLDGAIEKSPDNTELLYARGLVAAQLQLIELHEHDMRKLLEKDPTNAHALNALGYTLADATDRYQEAYELIERALTLRPEDPFILDSMGWVQYRLGNHDLAIEYLERALAKREDAEIAAHLGEVLWSVGQRERAEKVWNQALKKHPDNDVLRGTMSKLKQ